MNSTSRVMEMSSPTRTPPVSRAEFQVRPKSLRVILAGAEMPTRRLPQGSLAGWLSPSTSKVTGLVTPCRARSPVTVNSPPEAGVTLADLKVIVGNVSASKKSALFRWPSRCSSPVEMVLMGIEASIADLVTSASSRLRTPERPVNLPFTLEIIMCLTLNSAAEWAGSMFQVVVAAVMVDLFLSHGWMREDDIRCNKYFLLGGWVVERGSFRRLPVPHPMPAAGIQLAGAQGREGVKDGKFGKNLVYYRRLHRLRTVAGIGTVQTRGE